MNEDRNSIPGQQRQSKKTYGDFDERRNRSVFFREGRGIRQSADGYRDKKECRQGTRIPHKYKGSNVPGNRTRDRPAAAGSQPRYQIHGRAGLGNER